MKKDIFTKNTTRLDSVMSLLGVSARRLSERCDITNSAISRWQKGTRSLNPRSKALRQLVSALLSFDSEGQLEELLAPYRTSGESMFEALVRYLTTDDLPALPPRAKAPTIQKSGSYIVQQHVLLGEKGFRKAALLMLDYVMTLPPGRQIVVCAHSGFDLFLHNLPFTLQLIQRLLAAANRGTTLLLVGRRGFGLENDAHFARLWLVAHLQGILHSRFYEGEPPAEYLVASIPGYWSGEVEVDPSAEDGLITIMNTDPRIIRRAEAHCDTFIQQSIPVSQHGFLRNPQGDSENVQGWKSGPLPQLNELNALEPTGNFSAVCRVPSIGVMTKAEFETVLAKDKPPQVPDYLFKDDGFSQGRHRIIMCRDDIREGLLKERVLNVPLSELLHRRAFLSRGTLRAMLYRMLDAMAKNEEFEVALLPRSAFAKLELEIVCWQDSVAVGWLQNGSDSVFAHDPITSDSYQVAVGHAWDRLHKGWKRKPLVMRTLRKWLAGKELTVHEPDSATVTNWDVLPKE